MVGTFTTLQPARQDAYPSTPPFPFGTLVVSQSSPPRGSTGMAMGCLPHPWYKGPAIHPRMAVCDKGQFASSSITLPSPSFRPLLSSATHFVARAAPSPAPPTRLDSRPSRPFQSDTALPAHCPTPEATSLATLVLSLATLALSAYATKPSPSSPCHHGHRRKEVFWPVCPRVGAQ